MPFLRHALILTFLIGLFIAVGLWAPQILKVNPDVLLIPTHEEIQADSIAKADTLDFHLALKESLPVIGVRKKRSKQPELWTLGKGISLPVYLLRASEKIQAMNGTLVRMQELNKQTPSARIVYTTNKTDTFEVELGIGASYLENSSRLGLAFTVDSTLDIPTLNALNSLPCDYSLLVQPFDTSKALRHDLDKLKNKELVAWLSLEPHGYPWVKPGPKAILLHHSAKEIASIVEQAKKNLPQAVGYATRMGQRAVEHRPLLHALLSDVGRRKSWFLDLSANKFSKVSEICVQIDMNCRTAEIATRSKRDRNLELAMATATRTGNGIAVLPATVENVAAIHNLIQLIQERGTEIVKLSEIMSQSD